jgi:hypothetical protein
MPWGGGPPVPLRSCWVPQSRHSRYRLPSGPRRRCQRWSRSLHRQGLAIAASLAMSRGGLDEDNCRSDAEGHHCAAPSLLGRQFWISHASGPVSSAPELRSGRRRRGPGRRGACTSSHSTSDATCGTRSMPAFRSVMSLLLRALGDFSLRTQGRPCGRPAAALQPGNDTTGPGGGPHRPGKLDDSLRA